MMFLERLAEVIAKKRTKTGEKRDKALLKRIGQEKAVKEEKRKESDKKYQAKKKAEQQEKIVEAPKAEEKKVVPKTVTPTPSKVGKEVSKLKEMKNPSLFMINANVTATKDDDKEGKAQFTAFMNDDGENLLAKPKEVLDKGIYLSSKGGIHAWICSEDDSEFLQEAAFSHDLEHFPSTSADDKRPVSRLDLKSSNPFKELKLGLLHGVKNPNDLKNILQEAWAPIAEALASEEEEEKKAKPKEEPKEEPKQEEPEVKEDEKEKEDSTTIIDTINSTATVAELAGLWKTNRDNIAILSKNNKDAYSQIVKAASEKLLLLVQKENPPNLEKRVREALREFFMASGLTKEQADDIEEAIKEEKDKEDTEKDVDVTPASSINIGKLRSLRNPHMFILDPSKKPAQYADFLGPDEAGETPKASNVLPTAIKFLVSRQIKIDKKPLIVYILNEKQTDALKVELKQREASQPYYLLGPVDKNVFENEDPFTDMSLRDSEGRDVKLDKRLTDEMNRVLMDASSETSGNPMPAVQANSYVPINFFRLLHPKQRDVQLYIGGRPEGVGYENTIYVLTENEAEADRFVATIRKFKMPSLFYERMSANSDVEMGFKTTDPEVIKPANALILKAKTKFDPKAKVELTAGNITLLPKQLVTDAKAAMLKEAKEEKKKATPEKKKIEVTQLQFLHGVAAEILGNKTKNAGAFVKGRYTIGTLVAQFNADMSYCFLWGSHTQHVTVDEKELLEKMPFVKQVITSYL